MIGKIAVLLSCSLLCFNVAPTHEVEREKWANVAESPSLREFALAKEQAKKEYRYNKVLQSNRKPENIRRYTLSAIKNFGWGLGEYSCLYSLWMKESKWHWYSHNKSSDAYGIPQASPGRKMSSAGSDWKVNPFTQIKWGLNYIDRRYGSPCVAWRVSKVRGWY
jgi:hypothetical protein